MNTMNILVLNAGSSSLKYRVYRMEDELPLFTGLADRLNTPSPSLHTWTQPTQTEHNENLPSNDFETIVSHVFTKLTNQFHIDAIGHRIVHGGAAFTQPTLITPSVLEALERTIVLAPLHNPANLAGIKHAIKHYPQLPHVAIFDTAFHQTLPEHAYRYAINEASHQEHDIRRYGFHGTAHHYLAHQSAMYLQRPLNELNLITLHLGNGASVTAIADGQSVDTSMGMTPMEGLVMGTRCGDIDPGIIFKLINQGQLPGQVEQLLNRESGLKGLCGTHDMREIQQRASENDPQAHLALRMFCYRIQKYIGAYIAVLGRVDALIFSGGIGEHSPQVRAMICDPLKHFNIAIDSTLNHSGQNELFPIHQYSGTPILVIHANEELDIARQVQALLTTSPHM